MPLDRPASVPPNLAAKEFAMPTEPDEPTAYMAAPPTTTHPQDEEEE